MNPEEHLTKWTSSLEVVTYTLPESNRVIRFTELYRDTLTEKKVYIRCDLCNKPIIIYGKPNKRGLHRIDEHRGKSKCLEEQWRRRNEEKRLQARAEFEEANRMREQLFETLGASSSSDMLSSTGLSTPCPAIAHNDSSEENIPNQSHPTAVQGQAHPITPGSPRSAPAEAGESPSQNPSPLPASSLANSMVLDGSELDSGDAPINAPIDSWSPVDEAENEPSPELPEAENLDTSCQGQRIEWTVGSVYETYNYRSHSNPRVKLPWVPHTIESDRWIRLQSRECRLTLKTAEEIQSRTCRKCQRLANHPRLREFMRLASQPEPPATTNHSHLTPQQMESHMKRLVKQVNRLKLEKENLKKRLHTAHKHLDQYDKILVCISQNNLRSASRVLHRSLKRGDGLLTTLDKLVAAVNGKGKERAEWNERDLDVANLVCLEGGPRLLYALSKSEGMPSRSTIKRRRPIPELVPSIGTPRSAEINANITSFYGKRGRLPPKDRRVGLVLMIDDVALEEVPRYDASRNCVLGFCREHLGEGSTNVDSMDDVNRLGQQLSSGHIHHGKEATVIATAPVTGTENYYPSPLVASCTCKAEDGRTSAQWIQTVLDTWKTHEYGEAVHGPITAIATDGASQFRTMRFILCHSQRLNPNSAVGRIIYRLKGMNRRTGPHGILGTCDVKHILKRFATRLRSPTGIQVDKSKIQPDHILDLLQKISGLPIEKARILLNPTDKQNVPSAVNLLQTLLDLQKQSAEGEARIALEADPALLRKLKDTIFISEVLGYFLLPFITVNMTLSQQIRYLSTFAHLTTALYRKHKNSFLTSQLYADSQAIVKNIIYTTARLQSLKARIPYYILFEGTDRLEGVFSHARTQDHARNFDILQLAHKLSIGAEINAIFERRPELDRGHKRLNLVNARGVDHINPRSWTGSVIADDVDIETEYNAGRDAALKILERQFGPSHGINFDALFSSPNVDHLRPFGQYVGTKHKDEEAEGEGEGEGEPDGESEVEDEETGLVDEDEEDEDPPNASIDTSIDTDPDDEDISESQSTDASNFAPGTTESEDEIIPISEDEVEDSSGNIIIEPSLNPPDPSQTISLHMVIDGKKLNKHTLVSQHLAATSNAAHKVTQRFFRVRGDTTEALLHGKKKLDTLSSMSMQPDEDRVSLGDPGAILVRTGDDISLAVCEVLNFRQGASTKNLGSVPTSELRDEKKSTTVALQLLELAPRFDENNQSVAWEWTGDYLKIAEPGPTDALMDKHVALRTKARQFIPLIPSRTGSGTWSFDHKTLETTLRNAWQDMEPEEDGILSRLNALPSVDPDAAHLPLVHPNSSNPSLPYSLFITNPVSLSSPKLAKDAKPNCKLCTDMVGINDMRNHVGFHILKAHRGVHDGKRAQGSGIGRHPCGWCGLEGCLTEISVRTRRAPLISSNCPYHYASMQYGRATTSSKATPCTNVPIQCTLCPKNSSGQHPTIWKYNFWHHYDDIHAVDEDSGQALSCPPELLQTVRVSFYEEKSLGIGDEVVREWRGTRGVLESDVPGPNDYVPPVPTLRELQQHPLDTFGGFTFVDTGVDARKRSLSNVSALSGASQTRPYKATRLGVAEEEEDGD